MNLDQGQRRPGLKREDVDGEVEPRVARQQDLEDRVRVAHERRRPRPPARRRRTSRGRGIPGRIDVSLLEHVETRAAAIARTVDMRVRRTIGEPAGTERSLGRARQRHGDLPFEHVEHALDSGGGRPGGASGSIMARYCENRAPIRGAIRMMPCDRSQPGRSEVTKLSGAIRACDRRQRLRVVPKSSIHATPTVWNGSVKRPGRPDAAGQEVEIMYQHFESDGDILEQHAFVGMMAHAARAAQEEHRHRRHRGHHAGIVPGAADQAVRVMAAGGESLAQPVGRGLGSAGTAG